jgi:hypothetical protein
MNYYSRQNEDGARTALHALESITHQTLPKCCKGSIAFPILAGTNDILGSLYVIFPSWKNRVIDSLPMDSTLNHADI